MKQVYPIHIVVLLLLLASYTAWPLAAAPAVPPPRVNVPLSVGAIHYPQMAVFWFGQVNSRDNYVDVRVGYNDQRLDIDLGIIDRWLWYDASPSPADLTTWDSATLYLNLAGNVDGVLTTTSYRLEGQLGGFNAAYRYDGAQWITTIVPFTTTIGWRGEGMNAGQEARGWRLVYHLSFAELGLASAPDQATIWGMALVLHDRDDAQGSPIPNQVWPQAFDPTRPATWAALHFGLPQHTPAATIPTKLVTIRQGLNGAAVADGHVGGHTVCGGDFTPIFFNGWGDANYTGYDQVNVQNQADIADWPCFSKYYVTFPLDALPPSGVVVSATLTMHQFGNAGAPGEAVPSMLQFLTVAADWQETTLTWNNAPLAQENVAMSWAEPIVTFPGWPGIPVHWDLSYAVAAAHRQGVPLRLALYSTDSEYHSGKYFTASDIGDWNAIGRPTLRIQLGEPLILSHITYLPTILK